MIIDCLNTKLDNIDCTITKSNRINIDGVNTKMNNMNIDSVPTKLDNLNNDCLNTKLDNIDCTITQSADIKTDCTITKSGDINNIDDGKTEITSPSQLNESEQYDIFKQLPLEIINQIVLQLDFNDVLNLKLVSKMWRCSYLNQNDIWARICKNLNIRAIDYNPCLNDRPRHDSECKGYSDIASEKLFGSLCDNWITFNHYITVIKNMKNNDYPIIFIPRRRVEQSYYTDDYIVNINYYYRKPIEIIIIKGANKPLERRILPIFPILRVLIEKCYLKNYPCKVIGNKRFLVIEICSIIFVYSIKHTEFNKKFFKVIQKSVDYGLNKDDFNEDFLIDHCDTKVDLYENKLALVHPATSTLFVTDLSTEKTCEELKFSSSKCVVDSIKCSDYRLMIGITKMNNNKFKTAEHMAILYHMEGCRHNNRMEIPLLGHVTQFKVTRNCVGVENKGYSTPFIRNNNKSFLSVFWLECDTFSFDCTRNHIYYNVNQSIFQYDLLKSMLSKVEAIQRIAVDAISKLLPLTPINDRYLLVKSILPNTYEIFDVKEHISVRFIQLTPGYSLVHVGKLSIMFSHSHEIMVISFV